MASMYVNFIPPNILDKLQITVTIHVFEIERKIFLKSIPFLIGSQNKFSFLNKILFLIRVQSINISIISLPL